MIVVADEVLTYLLKLIFVKNINVRYLKFCFTKRRGLVRYNKMRIDPEKLTKEEYELFKGYVKGVENDNKGQ